MVVRKLLTNISKLLSRPISNVFYSDRGVNSVMKNVNISLTVVSIFRVTVHRCNCCRRNRVRRKCGNLSIRAVLILRLIRTLF